MTREAAACLWPRAIIDVIPLPSAHAATANILRNFDPRISQTHSRIRLDVTHLQSVMGPPFHIAQHIKRRLSRERTGEPVTMGVASDPYVAAYAAGIAKAGTIKAIAPWEVRDKFLQEPIDSICQLTPALASKLKRVGILTGYQIAEQPLTVIKRVFGYEGEMLWRKCRGETSTAALEVDEKYHTLNCRAVLPPRTVSQRSIHSHLRRVCSSLFSILRERQRIATVISFSMQEQSQPVVTVSELEIGANEFSALALLDSVKQAFSQRWRGEALHYIELGALRLYSAGGQLELFT